MSEVNVRKRENGKWQYYFEGAKINGKRKKITKSGFKTKKEALEAGTKALNEYNNAGTIFVPSEISYSDFLDHFLEDYVKLNGKPNTVRNYKTLFKRTKERLGIYKLKSITPELLQGFLNDLYKDGYSKNYISQYKTLLTTSFKYAVYPCKYIKESPALYITLPKKLKNSKNKKVLTSNELKTIFTRFDEESNMYVFLHIAFHTGLRRSEVAALTWDNINFENKTLTVDKNMIRVEGNWIIDTPKTESSNRTIRLGDTIIDILKKWKKRQAKERLSCGKFYINNYIDNENILYNFEVMFEPKENFKRMDFICTNHYGKTVTSSAARYISEVINKKLGIEFNFHMLRHTHATMLIEAGANIKDVQVRLGHSEIATTMDTYSHVTKKMQDETVDIFEKKLKKDLSPI